LFSKITFAFFSTIEIDKIKGIKVLKGETEAEECDARSLIGAPSNHAK